MSSDENGNFNVNISVMNDWFMEWRIIESEDELVKRNDVDIVDVDYSNMIKEISSFVNW